MLNVGLRTVFERLLHSRQIAPLPKILHGLLEKRQGLCRCPSERFGLCEQGEGGIGVHPEAVLAGQWRYEGGMQGRHLLLP